ncbi:hypothetical protein HBI55_204180 [Parastagonospora nodorum]|nr:hypothetical protein HBI55_204180 [Parastagonospora nodorum]
MTLEVVKLVEDLTSYYSAKVKTEDLSNTLTLTLSETAQQQSSSVVSNRSTASITNKFSVASLTKPAILNNANIALVDAVHHSVVKQFPMFRLITKESQQKLEENYFKVIDALTMTLIKDDDDLLDTVNSHIKLRRLRAPSPLEQPLPPKKRGRYSKLILDGPPLKRRKTEAADSRHAKASGGRTKKDKDSEDSNTSSDQLGKEAQLKKTRDEEELAKAKKEKEEKEAQKRETYSSDIDPEDNLEDEEATTAKDLAREQKERLKALLNAKTRDSLSARVGTAIEHCTLEDCNFTPYQLTDAYILYFKELSSNNSGIFANAIGIEVQNAQAEGDATEHNAVDDDDKLCSTEGERTFHCACKRSPSFNAEPQQAAIMMTKNISRLTKEEAMEMRIDTTNAISKALAAANKLVALRSYTIPEANTPAVHPKATKHCLAPSAARFIIVCGFRKVDKHVFRAYNTISVTAQQIIIRKGGPYMEKRAILLPRAAVAQRFMLKRTLKTRNPWGKLISGIKGDFLTVQNAEQQCRDILEKEGLNKSEASRRVIFNRFEMQAIASYPALATLKAAQFKIYSSRKVKRFTSNSVKDLFTNPSKDYFLVREARAITKSSLKFQNLSNLCSKIIVASIAFAEAITLTEATHVVIIEPQDRQNTQDQFMFRVYRLSQLAEMYVGIVYFNLDSKLELKVLGKQDVKTTSQDKL